MRLHRNFILILGIFLLTLLVLVRCSSAAPPDWGKYTETQYAAAVTVTAPVPPKVAARPASRETYGAGLSIDIFGTVRTPDLQKNRLGVGIAGTYYFDNSVGLGVEVIQENFGHSTVDEGNVLLYYRIPLKANALYLFGGGGRNFIVGEYNVLFGGGLERKITKTVSAFGDARLVKTLDHDPAALARLGLRLSF